MEFSFCTEDDILAKESEILSLVDSGSVDTQISDASQDIVDELMIREIVTDQETLTNDIRQLRLPTVYKTLANIFRSKIVDDDSPYETKAKLYEGLYSNTMSLIKSLDLDLDKDGVIDKDEEGVCVTRMMRRVS